MNMQDAENYKAMFERDLANETNSQQRACIEKLIAEIHRLRALVYVAERR